MSSSSRKYSDEPDPLLTGLDSGGEVIHEDIYSNGEFPDFPITVEQLMGPSPARLSLSL
jgi:hypothetical protein